MVFNSNNKQFESPEDAILIVDDEPDVRALLKKYLKESFANILEAGSIKEACSLITNHTISLALIDIGLPDGSGLELLKKLLTLSPHSVPIVLTGNPDREVIKEALKYGAHDFLDKPCEPELIKHTVTRAHELYLYKNQMQDILELLICEYGKFEMAEYQQLSISQKAKLLDMIKGILSLKILRRKTDPDLTSEPLNTFPRP